MNVNRCEGLRGTSRGSTHLEKRWSGAWKRKKGTEIVGLSSTPLGITHPSP